MFVCDGITQSGSNYIYSGYISSDPPSQSLRSASPVCEAHVKNLPSNSTVRFNVIDLQVSKEDDQTDYTLRIGGNRTAIREADVVLRKSDSGQINLQTTRQGFSSENDRLRFNIRYTGELTLCFTN